MFRAIVLDLVVLALGQVAVAQAPFVENLYVSFPVPRPAEPLPADFVDIPQTEKTVTIPAGTAIITWALNIHDGGAGMYRPVIGGDAPLDGLNLEESGSWVTETEGGTVTIKMQVKQHPHIPQSDLLIQNSSAFNWTLIVFPEADPVPAVPTWGIVLMGLLMVTAATLVYLGRERRLET